MDRRIFATDFASFFDAALLFAVSFALAGGLWAQETDSRGEAGRSLAHTTLEAAATFEPQRSERVPETRETLRRESLESRGISMKFSYTTEGFAALQGGNERERRAECLGDVEGSLTLDLSKMGIGRGKIVISAQDIHGRGINTFGVGAIQTPSSLDNPAFAKLTEAYYSDTYRHNELKIKVGRQYADIDFNTVENGVDFMNSSYGLIPTIPLPTYPYPDFGASTWFAPNQSISIGAGGYRGKYPSAQDPSDETGKTSQKGMFTIAEVQLRPVAIDSAHYSIFRVGAWQQGRGAWLTRQGSNATAVPVRNYGVYATADYWFGKDRNEDRGPGIFLQWGWAPADRNTIKGYWGAGISYPGFLPQRRRDSAGLGVTRVSLSTNEGETIVETFYKWQVTKRLFVQPDLQWVRKTTGSGRNALIVGMRVGLDLQLRAIDTVVNKWVPTRFSFGRQ